MKRVPVGEKALKAQSSKPSDSAMLRSPRLIGWGLVAVAFVVGYLMWIVGRTWWWPSVIVAGIVLLAICAVDCYLAFKTKKYDLYAAALLAVLAPAVVISISFGFFFSGPPS
ncbi:hypothetical protein [Corynebacterium confusum]|uniref:hypothetical protein n=1 Tax=Corynebacterium confusum TaxID=71254 RepID=UPI0025B525E5|nr:hypothetical protein [Corynebacterium confusum]